MAGHKHRFSAVPNTDGSVHRCNCGKSRGHVDTRSLSGRERRHARAIKAVR